MYRSFFKSFQHEKEEVRNKLESAEPTQYAQKQTNIKALHCDNDE